MSGAPPGTTVSQDLHTAFGVERIRRETALAAVITDHQGIVTHVNDRFESLFGWSRAQIVGRSISEIIPPSLRDAHHLGLSRFLMTGEPTLLGRTLELRAIDCHGREFLAAHRIEAELRDGKWVFGATIEPRALERADDRAM